MLADMLTNREHSDKPLKDVSSCYLGDARFWGDSLMIIGSKLRMDVRLCAPEQLWPDPELVKVAREIAWDTGARLTLTADVDDAIRGVALPPAPMCGYRWARTLLCGASGSSC